MSRLLGFIVRARLLFARRASESRIDRELQFHIDMETERLKHEQSLDPIEARRRALATFGGMQQHRETLRDGIGLPGVDRFRSDLRTALRSLARAPGLAITTTAILAVGVGMAIAMSTVVRTVIVQRLPVRDPEQLVVLHAYIGNSELTLPQADRKTFERETRTFRDVAGIGDLQVASPNIIGDVTYSLRSVAVSGNFFELLGARPALGRLITPADDSAGLRHAVVLSYRAWREKFGGDPSVLGKRVADPWDPDYHVAEYVIVGVAPPGLDFPAGVDNWYTYEGDSRATPMSAGITIGRLAPGTTVGAARAEWLAFRQRTYEQMLTSLHQSGRFHISRADAVSLADEVLGSTTMILVILAAAVALLFIIACVNVGNLLLLRAASRSHELAVRRAIGASFGDILSSLLAEGVVIAAIGGVAGLLVASALLRALVVAAPQQLPRLDNISLAGAPVLTAALISLVATLLFAVAPGLAVARGSMAAPLRIDSRAAGRTRQRRRLHQTLVAVQTALAVVTLAGAGLLIHSFERLERIDLGFNPEHLSVFSLAYPLASYDSVAKVNALGDELLAAFRATSGVTAVSTVEQPPFLGANFGYIGLLREGVPATDAPTMVATDFGDPDLFRTLGLPIIRGRAFLSTDDARSERVMVVSRAVAEQLWPGQSPIGKRVAQVGRDGLTWRTVVGEVENAHLRTLRAPTPTVYLAWRQLGSWSATVAVRTSDTFAAVLPSLRRTLAQIDPKVTIWDARSLDDRLNTEMALPRLSSFVLGAFALVALLLAAIGLYGITAFTVREQTREIGLRMALGAGPERVRRDVLHGALSVIAFGGAAGLIGALISSRFLAGLLFQVQPIDPVALGATCLLLGLVASLAAYLPARRATRVDPAIALRSE